MAQRSNREDLLREGLLLVHRNGFATSGVRDIVTAARAPQGSFTNHFGSKEAFGLELIERYHDMTSAAVTATLRNDALAPLRRLRRWMTNQLTYMQKDDMRHGCLYGNMAAEASEHSELIRKRITQVFAENQKSVRYCLDAAVAAGELSERTATAELAGFIVSSLQGAILVAKAQRDPAPVKRFIEQLFASFLLEPKTPATKPRSTRAQKKPIRKT